MSQIPARRFQPLTPCNCVTFSHANEVAPTAERLGSRLQVAVVSVSATPTVDDLRPLAAVHKLQLARGQALASPAALCAALPALTDLTYDENGTPAMLEAPAQGDAEAAVVRLRRLSCGLATTAAAAAVPLAAPAVTALSLQCGSGVKGLQKLAPLAPHLTELRLRHCKVTALATPLALFPLLRRVELYGCLGDGSQKRTDEVLRFLATLVAAGQLVEIGLPENALKTPPEFLTTQAACIQVVNLMQNPFIFAATNGSVPASLCASPLRRLCLAYCGVRRLPPEMARLTALEALSLSGNFNLEADSLEAVWQLPHLTELYMASCGLTEVPAALCKSATALRVLDLEGNRGIVALRPALGHLTALEALSLSSTRISGCPAAAVGAALAPLVRLRKLNLARCRLTALDAAMSRLVALEELRIESNDLEDLPSELCMLRHPEMVCTAKGNNLPGRVCYLFEDDDATWTKARRFLQRRLGVLSLVCLTACVINGEARSLYTTAHLEQLPEELRVMIREE